MFLVGPFNTTTKNHVKVSFSAMAESESKADSSECNSSNAAPPQSVRRLERLVVPPHLSQKIRDVPLCAGLSRKKIHMIPISTLRHKWRHLFRSRLGHGWSWLIDRQMWSVASGHLFRSSFFSCSVRFRFRGLLVFFRLAGIQIQVASRPQFAHGIVLLAGLQRT